MNGHALSLWILVVRALRRRRHFQSSWAANRDSPAGNNALQPAPNGNSEDVLHLAANRTAFAVHKTQRLETALSDPVRDLALLEGRAYTVLLYPDPGAFVDLPFIPYPERVGSRPAKVGALRRDSAPVPSSARDLTELELIHARWPSLCGLRVDVAIEGEMASDSFNTDSGSELPLSTYDYWL